MADRPTHGAKPRQSGPKDTVWPLDPHTLAKHEILQRYLGAWFAIMSKYNRQLLFIDGFAGPGTYDNGEAGSPIIALKTLIEHRAFDQFGALVEYTFLFCEPDRERFESLELHLRNYQESLGGSWPTNVKVPLRNKPFNSAAREIIDSLDSSGRQLAPTFAFVDPFGVTGLPMDTLAKLTASPKSELFVNMIMNAAKRFATSSQIDGSLESLYGTDKFKEAEGLIGRDRIDFLHDLYVAQLRTKGSFPYIQSFEMVNIQGHTSYFLFYATRHLSGLKAMKDAMWKADPDKGSRFSDRLAGQDVLFSEAALDTSPLRANLLSHFAGKTVAIQDLEEYVLAHTPYRETHLRRPVLVPLEGEGIINVRRPPNKRQFPPGTLIEFPKPTA